MTVAVDMELLAPPVVARVAPAEAGVSFPWQWWLERRGEVRVGMLLAVLAVLNGFDLVYTLFAYRIGMLDEMNPLAAAYLSAGLVGSFICYKLLMVLAGSGMLWRLRRSAWAVTACWVIVGVYVGIGCMWYDWVKQVQDMYEMKIAAGF